MEKPWVTAIQVIRTMGERGVVIGLRTLFFKMKEGPHFLLARHNYVHAFVTTVAEAIVCKSICKSLGGAVMVVAAEVQGTIVVIR